MNKQGLKKHFKIHFGDTVYQWILKRKMEDVHSLVINTDMQINHSNHSIL
ncbi:hypothetical protein ING2E5B_0540 [Fermentimonas caenicola]|jgi:AraC-like DNA-binding protein|uniref:HTH araC/xylS-type domain-containing protein n=1 Tax=Fermentimonas caenicola TaxID=1562970 RepID=A0A098C060_9BACT|nr:hypothetical protein ING2E5B_0540 [Fermentimonas caenicola]